MSRIKSMNFKLTSIYSIIFFVIFMLLLSVTYTNIKKSLLQTADDAMTMHIEIIKDTIKSSSAASIKNYFRGTAYSALTSVKFYYSSYINGDITEKDAQEMIFDTISKIKIGESGYLFIADNNMQILAHPYPSLIGYDLSDLVIAKKMLADKEIYDNYMWQNPGEEKPKEKSIYSIFFDSWGWYIGVTGYQSEFTSLITFEDFEDKILSIQLGETGYPVVFDYSGKFLIHPNYKGYNFIDREDSMGEIMRKTTAEKNGKTYYYWKNPGEKRFRKKLTIFADIPELEIIVGVTLYESEFLAPLYRMQKILIIAALISFLTVLFLTRIVSRSITKPIIALKKNFEEASEGNLTVRSTLELSDEIGVIGSYFNEFIKNLDSRQRELDTQLELHKSIKADLENSLDEIQITNTRIVEEERFSSIGRLLARFSHHLNTPVGTAITAASFLNDNIKTIKERSLIKEAADLLKTSIERVMEMMNSFKLLQISKDTITYKEFNISTLLNEWYITTSEIITPEEISLIIKSPLDLSCSNSPELLKKVLDQLISNSLIHSFKERNSGEITIEINGGENGIIIDYRDNGVGIPIKSKERVFEPFFNEKDDFKSTGIGLSLIYNIVKVYMEGYIEYIGEEESGMRYLINLPDITE